MNKDLTNAAINLFKKHGKEYAKENFIKITPIHTGYTNQSYLLETNNHKFQIRLGQNNEIVNRNNEKEILSIIKDKYYIYYNENNGNAIKKWIDAVALEEYFNERQQILEADVLITLIKEIEDLHKINWKDSKIIHHDYFCFFNNKHDLEDYHKDLYIKLVNELTQDSPWVLSHNDLNMQNILITKDKKIIFIDYEWGRINHPLWDIANFIRESNLNLEQVKEIAKLLSVSYNKLLKFMYICTNFAYQWTFSTKYSENVKTYRQKTKDLLNQYYSLIIQL